MGAISTVTATMTVSADLPNELLLGLIMDNF